jgi:succinate dehydrogenase/fumarate reductase cytochrome b subunit
MTLARLMATMLLSASLWCGALAFLRATLTGARRGPDTWFFSLTVVGIVTALLFAVQSTVPGSGGRDRSS